MFQKLSLQTKAIGFAIALGTVPVLVIGAVAYYFANRSITQDVMRYQGAYATEISDKVNRFMFERYGDIQSIASLAIFADPRVGNLASMQQKEDALNRYLKVYQVYDNITIFNLQGQTVVQSKGPKIQPLNNIDYFEQVLETDRPIVSNPRISPSTKEWVIYLAAPVKNLLTGQTIAVVRSRLPVKQIQERIKSLENPSQQAHIIEASGKIFVTSNSEEINQEIRLQYPFLENWQISEKKQVKVALSQTDRIEKVVAIAATSDLVGMPNLNWLVLVDNDTDIAFKTQKELLITLSLGSGLTALLVSAIAVIITNQTTRSINAIVTTITSSTTEIAATIAQQERTATQQAASVNQTTLTMHQLSASSKVSAEQAKSATENARQVLNLAESSASGARQVLSLAESSASGARQVLTLVEGGTQKVERTLEEMLILKEKVGEITENIIRLSEQTEQIGSITNIVSNLASQTNLLALNAAVEAVRAGENGKGFGVVASEIRKLADQSKKSAEKINTLVNGIQSAINSTVRVTEEGKKTAASAIKISQETADAFTKVAEAIDEVVLRSSTGVAVAIEEVVLSNQQTSVKAMDEIATISQQIALTAQQQAIAIQQVVEAMNALNRGSVETASGLAQTNLGIQNLNEAAHTLKAVV